MLPVHDTVKRFSSGALPTVRHPHPHSPKLPHLWPTFATPLLTPTRCRRIPLLTGPPSTYPVGIGSSAIRPSIAPNRRRRGVCSGSWYGGLLGCQCRRGSSGFGQQRNRSREIPRTERCLRKPIGHVAVSGFGIRMRANGTLFGAAGATHGRILRWNGSNGGHQGILPLPGGHNGNSG